jgi:hypothetical protein
MRHLRLSQKEIPETIAFDDLNVIIKRVNTILDDFHSYEDTIPEIRIKDKWFHHTTR